MAAALALAWDVLSSPKLQSCLLLLLLARFLYRRCGRAPPATGAAVVVVGSTSAVGLECVRRLKNVSAQQPCFRVASRGVFSQGVLVLA